MRVLGVLLAQVLAKVTKKFSQRAAFDVEDFLAFHGRRLRPDEPEVRHAQSRRNGEALAGAVALGELIEQVAGVLGQLLVAVGLLVVAMKVLLAH
jgi:hypothetical protein